MNKLSKANFYGSCSGTAMVELAIILPLMLFLLFGITELGRALYQQSMLTQAVELGARYMARVNGIIDADDCSNDAGNEARWNAAVAVTTNLIQCGDDSAGGCDDPLLPNMVIDYIDVCGPGIAHASCTSPSACVITIRATADFQSIFGDDLVAVPGFRLGGVTLNAATQERYIGH